MQKPINLAPWGYHAFISYHVGYYPLGMDLVPGNGPLIDLDITDIIKDMSDIRSRDEDGN